MIARASISPLARDELRDQSPERLDVLGQRPLVRPHLEDPRPACLERLGDGAARPAVVNEDDVAIAHLDRGQRVEQLSRRMRSRRPDVRGQALALEDRHGLGAATDHGRPREPFAELGAATERRRDRQPPLQAHAGREDDDGALLRDRIDRSRRLGRAVALDFAHRGHAHGLAPVTPDERRQLALHPGLEEGDAGAAEGVADHRRRV